MAQIKLGGIKIFEERTCLTRSCPWGKNALSKICSNFANQRINVTLLTHIADIGEEKCRMSVCISELSDKYSSCNLMHIEAEPVHEVQLQSDVNIIALFPHDQRFDVTGMLIKLLVKENIYLFGFASSPSAICIIVSVTDSRRLIEALFKPFEFRSYKTPLDWHAAYKGQEQVLKEIVCSYQEKIIKVYNVVQYTELDFWKMILPGAMLPNFSQALAKLHDLGVKMPFLVAQPDLKGNIFMAFCLASPLFEKAKQIFTELLPGQSPTYQSGVSIFFLQGPHFGDRFGIVNALVGSLQDVSITPLALSCAVNSMSVVIPANDLNRAIQTLKGSFQIPEE